MQRTAQNGFWRDLFIPKALQDKNKTHKIAYIALTTAIAVVANMFFEFKLAETQFSLTLAVSALSGILIGPFFGFIACFLGDLVGFLYNSAGYPYMPWIGLSMGVVAFVFGVAHALIRGGKWALYIKIAVCSVLTFLLCTVGINTTAFWLLYAKGVPYFTYLVSRVFVQGQIWNSLFNYALLFIVTPALEKLKIL